MKKILLALAFVLGLVTSGQAADRYISTSGNDTTGTGLIGAPYKTFTKVLSVAGCGDNVILRDGTYTKVNNGLPVITKVCTASTRIVMKAEHERLATIQSDGTTYATRVYNSDYVTLDGIIFKSMDNLSGGLFANVQVRSSNHTIIQNSIFSNNNRGFNDHLLEYYQATGTHDLIGNEFYYYHRHAVLAYYTTGVGGARSIKAQRNFFAPRGYADIPGGYASATTNDGENAFAAYPASDVIFENNVCVGGLKCFAAEATNNADKNKVFGNIAKGMFDAFRIDSRGTCCATQMPKDNSFVHNVAIDSTSTGFYMRGAKNTVLSNNSAISTITGGTRRGFIADFPSPNVGDGVYSWFISNSLSIGHNSYGYLSQDQDTWSGTNVDSFNNSTPYSPATSTAWVSKFTTDPQMGTCLVYPPDGSNAKTNNWGATVLYRYDEAVLTLTKLWTDGTNEFPHGAIINGLNDGTTFPTSSPETIHTVLKVGSGGCSLPADYGESIPENDTPSNPSWSHQAVGTTGPITLTFTVPPVLDELVAFVLLRDGGTNAGQGTSLTSSCGSQSFLNKVRSRAPTSSTLHNVEAWTLHNPQAGSCTFTLATSGAYTQWALVIIENEGSGAYSAASTAANGLSASPATSVTTASGHLIFGATSGSSSATIVMGANQTFLRDAVTGSARLMVWSKAGANGGSQGVTQSLSAYWAAASVDFLSFTPVTPVTVPTGVTIIRR